MGTSISLFVSLVFNFIFIIMLFYINNDWYKCMKKLNDDWSKHCEKINDRWYQYCTKRIKELTEEKSDEN